MKRFNVALVACALSISLTPSSFAATAATVRKSVAQPATSVPVAHTVAPSKTDSALTGPVPGSGSYVNIALPPVGTARNQLMVFFAGTGGAPAGYQKIQTTAANNGFHVIGLVYPNDQSVLDLCTGQASNCQGLARQEIITGQNLSRVVNVDYENSITNRTIKLLQYLNTAYPKEGWAQYLVYPAMEQPHLNWAKIVAAGHSQGGGHAAMIGQLYAVARVVMFSATENADWTKTAHATPSDRYFGLADKLEEYYTPFTESWKNIGVPGALVSVDGAKTPYGNSHQLVTSDAPKDGPKFRSVDPYHAVGVTDTETPLNKDGTPVLGPVWVYMLTAK